MAMKIGSGSGTQDPDVMVDINTTPLIDVMLVLLIMLIITIPIQTHAVKLNMPIGTPPPPLVPPEVVTIEVDFDGTLIWNGRVVPNRQELEELKGREDPLVALAERIAKRYRLICFDEMHVNDIADAMIVGRLLGRVMDLGVVCCMTSNYRPDDLYKDGLKRENFLPTIALLKERLDILHVDGGVDYRQRMLEGVKVYHAPLGEETDRALLETFRKIAEVEEEFHELDVEGRVIRYRHRAGGVVWFDFKVICGRGRSQHDYLDLSKRFHTVIVSEVPRMGLVLSEEARRFTLMIDVLYDNRVKLIVSAEAAPEKLLKIEEDPGDAQLRALVFEFDRTASRLLEMQSRQYLAEGRRPPD